MVMSESKERIVVNVTPLIAVGIAINMGLCVMTAYPETLTLPAFGAPGVDVAVH
jgi:hypothetical protein